VDPIKIKCTGSLTQQSRTCGWHVVSQPLGAPNQYRAPNLKSLWPCSNIWLISPKNTSNSRWIMNNFTKWSWTWHHRVVIHVQPHFGRMVPGTTSLLLLLLQLRHCSNIIFFFKHIQFVMNIIYFILFYFWCLIKFYLHNWFFYY